MPEGVFEVTLTVPEPDPGLLIVTVRLSSNSTLLASLPPAMKIKSGSPREVPDAMRRELPSGCSVSRVTESNSSTVNTRVPMAVMFFVPLSELDGRQEDTFTVPAPEPELVMVIFRLWLKVAVMLVSMLGIAKLLLLKPLKTQPGAGRAAGTSLLNKTE